jgi:hypothetical protein
MSDLFDFEKLDVYQKALGFADTVFTLAKRFSVPVQSMGSVASFLFINL